MAAFSSLRLRDALLKNLETLGFHEMTPIQAQSLPVMLANKDVIAQAKTGSGKTAAFGLALLNRLNLDKFAVQVLVLCPTRELAEQVSEELRRLARLIANIKILNLSGGVPMRGQKHSLSHGAHVIVGTPGRIQKHIDEDSLSLNQVETLVLDEADRMLDMGFYDDIDAIIRYCPTQRQTLLFSATYPAEIKKLASKFMQNPQRIIVEENDVQIDIEQIFYELKNQKEKFALLRKILLHHKPASALIFCNTKDQTTQLAGMLKDKGFAATALNGDMEQHQRDVAVIRFKNQSSNILVATDVAARGIDVKDLPMVVNYDLAFERDVHTHRVGRTGRAGSKGLAVSLTLPADAERLCAIEDGLGKPAAWGRVEQLHDAEMSPPKPEMITLCLSAGKKDKIRPGDILGALTKDAGLPGNAIGKIEIRRFDSYVAVKCEKAKQAMHHFETGKLKARRVNVKKL